MDMNKFKDWMEMAKNLHGKDFWSSIFDQANFNMSRKVSDMFQSSETAFPRVDMYHNSVEHVIVIELPGLDKQNIHVTIEGANLRVKGAVPATYQSYQQTMGERFIGEFDRLIPLPEIVKKRMLAQNL